MTATLLLVGASIYGDAGVGLGLGAFGPPKQGGSSWSVPVSLGAGLQKNQWQVGLEARYERRTFLDRELFSTPGSKLVQALVHGGFGHVDGLVEHRFAAGIGGAYDSKLNGFWIVADAAYVLTHVSTGLYVRTGVWAGTIFGYRQRQEVAQLYVQLGWHFSP